MIKIYSSFIALGFLDLHKLPAFILGVTKKTDGEIYFRVCCIKPSIVSDPFWCVRANSKAMIRTVHSANIHSGLTIQQVPWTHTHVLSLTLLNTWRGRRHHYSRFADEEAEVRRCSVKCPKVMKQEGDRVCFQVLAPRAGAHVITLGT